MSVIDDLKRLERAGSERSKTTEKLIEAASNAVRTIIDFCGGELPETLPRGYGWVWHEDMSDKYDLFLFKDKTWIYDAGNGGVTGRESALVLSKDIATGWLVEVAAQLERDAKEAVELVEAYPAVLEEWEAKRWERECREYREAHPDEYAKYHPVEA